ncbi:hypothetical protein KCTC52924_02640 [Arenibacter antarcticus]|uniref:Uncharacterized protein n=1 Tax=Arenibacter antarcticus TaxID=2040469 RepID=A0ABW5VJU8_9FLAO|nr:hypothetical protein [Arenibacter sp. H213]MCM4168939.1 hypothetical protein [Arenibacter sp. H213]
MKTHFKLLIVAFILCSTNSNAQSVEGKLALKGLSRSNTIKQKTPVDLFKAFKEGIYTINFNFKTTNVKSDQIILFDMKTTVKHNGKTISETSRGGWPWIPGDMFVPIEAFDAIPAIQKLAEKGLPISIPGDIKSGNYEIIFQIIPSEGQKIKGGISPATMQFTINK